MIKNSSEWTGIITTTSNAKQQTMPTSITMCNKNNINVINYEPTMFVYIVLLQILLLERGNPGGLTTQSIFISSFFLIVTFRSRIQGKVLRSLAHFAHFWDIKTDKGMIFEKCMNIEKMCNSANFICPHFLSLQRQDPGSKATQNQLDLGSGGGNYFWERGHAK